MLTWRSHTSKSREKWPGICRECKSLWIICFLLNIVVVELVWGEEFEWPYICERQHTICRSDIELFKRDNVLPLTIYTVRYVQCATTPNSKQSKRKVFDFGYFMLMLLCFLIHLVWNSWHIFRCTLQIIVVHRLGSVIVFYVFLSSVSLLSRSQRQLASLFVCMPMVFCGVFMAVKSHTIAHMSNVSEAYFRSYFFRFRCFSFYTFSQIFRN